MSKSVQTTYATAGQTGGVAPTIMGPDRGMKEVFIIGGGILALAVGMGIFWISTQGDDVRTTSTPQTITAIPTPPPVAPAHLAPVEPVQSVAVAPALPTQLKDALHADVYFDFGRNGLTEEAKSYLRAHAAFLKKETDWGVIIQGSTDTRGSSGYNKKLGQQRAEAVRAFLARLGIPNTSMKVVSLGKEGTLCHDDSSECQQLNRRVHLEFIKVGAAHLAPPVPIQAVTPDSAAVDTISPVGADILEQPIMDRQDSTEVVPSSAPTTEREQQEESH